MDDVKAEFERAMSSLVAGERGLGDSPPDERSALVGACLLCLERLQAAAVHARIVETFVDVLIFQVAMMAHRAGPGAIADVRSRLEWHLADQAEAEKELVEGGKPHAH